MSVEDCVKTEIRGLGEYLRGSNEILLRFTLGEGLIVEEESVKDFKDRIVNERLHQWHTKVKHGQYIRKVEDIADETSWGWVKGGFLKKETEGLIFAAQEEALPTRSVRALNYKEDVSPKCRVCGEHLETAMHIVGGCPGLAGQQYKVRHDNIAKRVHWHLCQKYGIPCAAKWYQHVPSSVCETADRNVTIWYEMRIETDRKVPNNHPDIVVIDKKDKMWYIVDPTCPMDENVKKGEEKKESKYIALATEIRRMHHVKTTIVPISIGALGTVPKKLKESFEILGIPDITSGIQVTALIGSASILRGVLGL